MLHFWIENDPRVNLQRTNQRVQHLHFWICVVVFNSFMNEVDRHYERLEQTETALSKRAFHYQDSVEEIVSKKMELDMLRQAIRILPETQRRRLVLYYYEGLTYEKIAEMEGCTTMPVKRSIDAAIEKLKKYFD